MFSEARAINFFLQPYSYSVGIAVSAAFLAWVIVEKGFGRPALGRAELTSLVPTDS